LKPVNSAFNEEILELRVTLMFQTRKWSVVFVTSLAILSIGCFNFELPEISETTAQTYDEYKSEYDRSFLDPTGASNISMCTAFEGDGYDEWWRFEVSEADFENIATAVAKTQNGPTQVEFSSNATPPGYWKPDAKIPTWWTLPGHDNLISINWCVSVGSAERHHGWFLLLDQQSGNAFVWHWNHQWSSDKCR